MSNLLEAALHYARSGWAVFPLVPRDKRPLEGTAGHHDATTDEAQVRAWWSAMPDANVGIATAASGLVVLDVDTADGKGGAESLADMAPNLVRTRSATTGSGGAHLIYARTHDDQIQRKIRFRPGLDALGDGYIVAPPSIHPSGGVYHWNDAEAPIAAVPPALHAVFGPRAVVPAGPLKDYPPATPEVLAHARARLERHGPAIPGQGGDVHTFEVGAILLRGYALSWDEAWGLACEWNARNPVRQWSPDRLAEKLRNGATYGQGRPGAERDTLEMSRAFAARLATMAPLMPAPGTWAHDLAAALADVQSTLAATPEHAAPEPLFVPSAEIHRKTYGPTPWLCEGLVTEGAVSVIGGEPKISKTWVLTELACAVATGRKAFGQFPCKQRRVAYFYAEDLDRQVRNRQRALDDPALLTELFVQPRGRFLDVMRDEDLALVVASCRRLGDVGLLILEPLRDIHSGEEDGSDSMAQVMRRLRLLGEILSCTVAVAHHMAKASADAGKRRSGQKLRGSGAIHGSVDCGIYLSNLQGDGRTEFGCDVQSEIKGARSAGYFGLTLKIEDDEGGEATNATWTYSNAPKEPEGETGDLRERVLEVVRTWPADKPLPQGVLADNLGGRRQRALAAIRDLLVDGTLRIAPKKFSKPGGYGYESVRVVELGVQISVATKAAGP